jgi:heptosyltransferase-2
VIRFSSFGDIVQAMAVPQSFLKKYPGAQVDWLVRSDFAELLKSHLYVHRTIPFERKEGLQGLWKISGFLAGQNYSHIYDAHNNLRSWIVRLFLFLRSGWVATRWLCRPKNRLRRWLFFHGHWPVLPQPFKGVLSFHSPLQKWKIPPELPAPPQFFVEPQAQQKYFSLWTDPQRPIVLVPSAAWEMKRWPVEHWKKLIALMPESKFAVLGGPYDSFCEELKAVAPQRVLNFAGQLSLQESSAFIAKASAVVSADTGLLHVADQLGRPTLALIGPTAFGYPSRSTSVTLEVELSCKPCSKDGRGRCTNSVYQKCMHDIRPEQVAQKLLEILK